jgi:hypothetical protein
MGSLGNKLNSKKPAQTTGKTLDVGPDGGLFEDIQTDAPISDWSEVFRQFKLDPDIFEIVQDTVRMSQWQQSKALENGDRDVVTLYSTRAQFRRKKSELDLPALYAAAKARPRARVKTTPTERTTVAVLADPQIGKTGRRGGTPELIDRMAEKREKLDALLKVRKPSTFGLLDAGDGFEGFESGGNPMFTNDLSLGQQMDCYGTELYSLVELGHRHAPVVGAGVPSNHTAWRNGRQNLGNPQDDLGMHVQTQMLKVAKAAKLDVTWSFPAPYDESVAVKFFDTVVGMVHGNQFGPGGAVAWWEKQTFGAQAIASADVLITGHYHIFGAGVAGRNPSTGRQRYHLAAPTLDNGSDWYRTIAGRDSDPGMLVFDLTADGFDLQSLTIL